MPGQLAAGVPPISDLQLALSVGLILVAGLVSALLRLGLLRSLLWGTARTFIQLTLIGYVLAYIFAIDHPLLVAGLIGLMCMIAAHAALQRTKSMPFRPYGLAMVALAASTYLVGGLVCGLILGAERWPAGRVAIPIAGMILGNALTAISLALDRFFGEVRARADEVETRLCLGFSQWEAVRPQLREALRAGMTPIINALMVVGLVSVPGMMSGQILAGVDPLLAVRYQIVVMLMLAAGSALSCLIMIGLSYKRCFTDEGALLPDLLDSGQGR